MVLNSLFMHGSKDLMLQLFEIFAWFFMIILMILYMIVILVASHDSLSILGPTILVLDIEVSRCKDGIYLLDLSEDTW